MPTSRVDPARRKPLADEAARRAIREDLDSNILVEAAAGTGKTACLVDRMVALIASGKTTVDRLSAVTFTIKAAGQLRQRFQNELEKALGREKNGPGRERLRAALSQIDSCFVGTIHAFAARLLRERPVEAGIDPGFVELDEPEDATARGEAWDRHVEALFQRGDPDLARVLELGVFVEDLRQAYDTLCENSDVAIAAPPPVEEPDFDRARSEVARFLEQTAAAVPAEPPRGGWTKFQLALRKVERLWNLLDARRAADFVQIAKPLRSSQTSEGAGTFKKSLERLRREVVAPALLSWEEFLYPTVIALLEDARQSYAAWRLANGRRNFQDLLIDARNLLRDHPSVRDSLRERFTPILVDEFQDTDPIQAEILFYLTGMQTEERDWRKLAPSPGSLFLVGDPKQSIYRFRRADLAVYDGVRRRIATCGRLLEISTNFRSTPELCAWINGAFGRPVFFGDTASPEQAAWVPLSPIGPETGATPVLRLEITTSGRAQQPVVENDARRIAEVISRGIADGARRPRDFLILLRRRKFMASYAAELERRGIPSEIGGGGAFRGSEELESLLPLLQALADPDDPVPLVAVLRGPYFGVDDEALYLFARAGGRFLLRRDPPQGSDPRIERAWALLRQGAEFVETLPPAAAIARLTETLGGIALAASRELGDSRAGNVLKALAAARTLSAQGRDFAAVVEELSRLREQELIEQMNVEPGRADAVRLLTIHGAKGLEAPVVFLADPTGDGMKPRPYCIDRSVDPPEGYLHVVRRKEEDYAEISIARPSGWDEREAIEKRFEDAERSRLLYVGATRAREMLIVSIWRKAKGGAEGPWAPLDRFLPADLPEQRIERASEPAEEPTRLDQELEAFRSMRAERARLCSIPSYSTVTVTALTHATAARPARESTGRGMEWGRILHRLLEAVMRDPALDVRAYARNLFTEEERPPDDLEEVAQLVERVRASPLWARALAARRCLVEVPFALLVSESEISGQPRAESLLQGAIDLVFEEAEGWILVDYKSDIVSDNRAGLVEFYRPQVEHYRRAWERLTGRRTKAGLYFIETGEEVWLS